MLLYIHILKGDQYFMQPLLKWPGGKSSEIEYIKDIIPSYDRYIEPFCGGGAVYFYLEPNKAVINDISKNLTDFYMLIKGNNEIFKKSMYDLNFMWDDIKVKAKLEVETLVDLFNKYKQNDLTKDQIQENLYITIKNLLNKDKNYIIDVKLLEKEIKRTLVDKFFRTYKNEIKNKQELSLEDLKENLLTGIASGIYMAVRSKFNSLEKTETLDENEYPKKIAYFYFIREFCYGSMFRYNKNGDFNIPYGGKGYNHKDYKKKLDTIFSETTIKLLKNTEIKCGDFEEIFKNLNENDFVFLDPPYDTDFSDYENKSFDKKDQERLATVLEHTKARFILIIKNTPFIYNLYNKACFKIRSFDNNYSYCVKNRNNRKVEHLIVTNY